MINWGPFGAKSLQFILTPPSDDARITILHGAVRSQKTVSMIPKWLNYIKTGPQGLLAMTGVSKQTLKRNVLNDLFDTVGRRNYSYNQQTGEMRIFDRALQVIGIKDEGSEKYLRGPTFAGAYCDELTTMPQSSFKQLLNRLSIDNSRLYGTTNTDSPYHYLYNEYITDEDKLKSGMVRAIHFEIDDNPTLSEEYKAFIRSAYSGLWYKRMILGLWVQAEGAIYDAYDEARHCVTRDDLPDRFTRGLIGIDFGAANPTAFVKLGVQGAGPHPTIWQYGEYYYDGMASGRSKTTAEYKRDLVEFMGGRYRDATSDELIAQPQPFDLYIDPSALPFILELQSASCGIRLTNQIRRANNDVLAGINSVATLISQDRYKLVREDCPNTAKEIVSYIWDAKKQLLGEDAPVKEHDHCMDALRYPVHTAYPAATWQMGVAAA